MTSNHCTAIPLFPSIRQRFAIPSAAQALHTSQPGVSRQLRLLEEEIGAVLVGKSIALHAPSEPSRDRATAMTTLRVHQEAESIDALDALTLDSVACASILEAPTPMFDSGALRAFPVEAEAVLTSTTQRRPIARSTRVPPDASS